MSHLGFDLFQALSDSLHSEGGAGFYSIRVVISSKRHGGHLAMHFPKRRLQAKQVPAKCLGYPAAGRRWCQAPRRSRLDRQGGGSLPPELVRSCCEAWCATNA